MIKLNNIFLYLEKIILDFGPKPETIEITIDELIRLIIAIHIIEFMVFGIILTPILLIKNRKK